MLSFFKSLFYFFNPKEMEMIDLTEEQFKNKSFDEKFKIVSKELQEKFNPTFDLLEKSNNKILVKNIEKVYVKFYKENIITNLRFLGLIIWIPILFIHSLFMGFDFYSLLIGAWLLWWWPHFIYFFIKFFFVNLNTEKQLTKMHYLKEVCLEHCSLLMLLEEVEVEYKEILSKDLLKNISEVLDCSKNEKLNKLIDLYTEIDFDKVPKEVYSEVTRNSQSSLEYIVDELENISWKIEKVYRLIEDELKTTNSLYSKLKNPLEPKELDDKLKEYQSIIEKYKEINDKSLSKESENLKIINKEYQLLLLQKIFVLKNSLKLGGELREKGKIVVLDSYKTELEEQVKNLMNLQMKIRNSVTEKNIKNQINGNLTATSKVYEVLK